MSLEIVELKEHLEDKFWNEVNQDPLDYYFFILDWKFNREYTRILLALGDDRIEGMMLLYKDHIVQLRGSREAVGSLLDHLDFEKVNMMAPKECEDLVLKLYQPKSSQEVILMHMKRGEERIERQYETLELSEKHAGRIADIMKAVDPVFWGDTTDKSIKESLDRVHWVGIERHGKIVSIANTQFADFGSNIGVVATDEAFQNRGYATSVVSSLVTKIMERSDAALIHVLASNYPAIHVYEKVGFKPFKSYLLMKGERV